MPIIGDQRITSFRDLEVYRDSYDAMLVVMREVVPKLPANEMGDLKDQMSRGARQSRG